MQAGCQLCAPVAGASEQHASAALRPAPNLAGRPSWVRPQQQPTAVPPSAAEQASDAEPLTQPYPTLHTAICPPPDLAANLEGGASGYDHAVRPGEAGTPAGIEGGTEAGTAAGTASGTEAATAAGIEGGTEAGTESGAAVQAGSTAEQAHHTQVSAQMTHKPFVFDIEDSCDGNQAQPAFIIDIDDFPEPAAQVTCDLPPDAAAASSAQAGSGTLLRTSSPSARATAQLPSAAPLQTRRQSASVMAGKPKLVGVRACRVSTVSTNTDSCTLRSSASPAARSHSLRATARLCCACSAFCLALLIRCQQPRLLPVSSRDSRRNSTGYQDSEALA